MPNTPVNREAEKISALIRSEEEAALAVFRSRDFPARMKRAWRDDRKRDSPGRKLRPALAWIFASAFLVVVGATVILLHRPSAPVQPPEFRSLVSALEISPGASTLSRVEPIGPVDPGRSASPGLAEYVLTALISGKSSRGAGEKKHTPLPEKPIPPSGLSLYQKMEILLKDKVIERSFLTIKNPSKEVIS